MVLPLNCLELLDGTKFLLIGFLIQVQFPNIDKSVHVK